ncbi:BMP family ABC transporter substrate-binding protein [Paenarthrobacter sp. GOM3]|uniref:BMP family ABC transporter substrate-binding protein n=1 Tax=Paenarthrobacter sp. GOM3 TaxID=2782567 RepID=UPI001BACBD01|nr:BMP family ABC transporter substrate-binding protein [Paenarthrobacter sp. GOM3]WOH20567.1 BMP family ABC transporter substrate-binding protein [Paenarthrobacter sp. GOM3]
MKISSRPLTAALISIAASALLLSGCSATASSNGTSAGNKSVTFVTTQPAGDGAGIDDLVKGLEKLKNEANVSTKTIEATDPSTYESAVRNAAQTGTSVIAGAFPDITNALRTVAGEFPDTQFVHIFADAPEKPVANLTSVSFDVYKAAYLSGYAAGSLTKTNTLGWIGGAVSPLLNANFHAYKQGAQAANPNVKVISGIVGSFSDPAKARDIALGMISQGADMLQTDAGGSSLGIIQAAETKGALILTDASDAVAQEHPQTVVGRTYLRFGDALSEATNQVLQGGKALGTYAASLDKDLVGLEISQSFLNGSSSRAAEVKSLQPKMDELKKQIIDGQIKINYDTNGL